MRALALLLVVMAACDLPRSAPPGAVEHDAMVDADWDADLEAPDAEPDAVPKPPACLPLTATLRDFKIDHPDFEDFLGSELGLVETQLGGDGKPVYAPPGASDTVTSPASFAQWYRDVAGVNMTFQHPMTLAEVTAGMFVYDVGQFFPLDGMGWGAEGLAHNFHFTTEIHGHFVYEPGSSFTFVGDDDVFVFVNDRLAIDMGGLHGPQTGTVDFDGIAATFGLTVGNIYSIDIFHAERHTTQSNFRIQTSLPCISVDPG